MKNETKMQALAFEGCEVRTVLKNGETWWNGTDVCNILGYERASNAIDYHVEEGDAQKICTPTISGNQDMWYVNESGLYSLILGSKLEGAKRFKRWVTSEVLPAIRKYGFYSSDPKRMERERVKADQKATKALCDEMSKHLKTGDLRMVGRQCMVDEQDVLRVLYGYREDVSVMTGLVGRALDNRIKRSLFYSKAGAERLLRVLQTGDVGIMTNGKSLLTNL